MSGASSTRHSTTASNAGGRGDVDGGGSSAESPECSMCLPKGVPNTVESYPRKPPKKASKEENVAVVVVCRRGTAAGGDSEYLISQRPKKGLLANMWEFPNGVFVPAAANVAGASGGGSASSKSAGAGAGARDAGAGAGGGESAAGTSSSLGKGANKEAADLKEAIRRSLLDGSADAGDSIVASNVAADSADDDAGSAGGVKGPVVVSPFFTLNRSKPTVNRNAGSKGSGNTAPAAGKAKGKGKREHAGGGAGSAPLETGAAKKSKKISAAATKAATMDAVAKSAAASAAARHVLATSLGVPAAKLASVPMQPCGAVLHIFSHIRHTYSVWRVDAAAIEPAHVEQFPGLLNGKWLSRSELLEAAVSTNMKKVFACVEKAGAR